jgi:hypothetical protein
VPGSGLPLIVPHRSGSRWLCSTLSPYGAQILKGPGVLAFQALSEA